MALANKETTQTVRGQANDITRGERLPIVSLILGALAFISILVAIPMAFL